MRDPFKLTGPTCLSFSGGRTSAYMLWRVLQANTKEDIARWLVVCFANTGLEHEATLRFVKACAEHWGATVVWVEYRDDEAGFALVDFETASRNGEPFEAIIRKRKYLPNPVTRFCTVELKIRSIYKYLRSLGLFEADDAEVDMMVGIRADEPRRIAKMRNGKHSETTKLVNQLALAEAGVSVGDVGAFWKAQPFDLELASYGGRTLEGNCVLCFLKPAKQVQSLIAKDNRYPVFYIKAEEMAQSSGTAAGDGARFRMDRPSYAQMLAYVQSQRDMFTDVEEQLVAAATEPGIDCFCGD